MITGEAKTLGAGLDSNHKVHTYIPRVRNHGVCPLKRVCPSPQTKGGGHSPACKGGGFQFQRLEKKHNTLVYSVYSVIRTHALSVWQNLGTYATPHEYFVAQMAAHPKKIRIDVLDTLGAW
jgi:hypothetical protein